MMNDIVVSENRVSLVAGGEVSGIIPRNVEEVYRLATAFTQSGLAPRGMETKEKIVVAIMAGADLGLAPFQAVQGFAIINGRPTLWGDAMLAVVRSHRVKVAEWFDDPANPTIAYCKVTRPDTGEEIERAFSIQMAKTAKLWGKQGPWTDYPYRMLQMRARAWACRDGVPDVLEGFQMAEEARDTPKEVEEPTTSGIAARLASNSAQSPTEGFNAVSGGIIDVEIEPASQLSLTASADTSPSEATSATTPDSAAEPGLLEGMEQEEQLDYIRNWARAFENAVQEMRSADEIRKAWSDEETALRFGLLKTLDVERAKSLHRFVTAEIKSAS
jgi:hypothetical protein